MIVAHQLRARSTPLEKQADRAAMNGCLVDVQNDKVSKNIFVFNASTIFQNFTNPLNRIRYEFLFESSIKP